MVSFPKFAPEIVLRRMQTWIAWHYRAIELPIAYASNGLHTQRVLKKIRADGGRCVAAALLSLRSMITRLTLETMGSQGRFGIASHKGHSVELIAIEMQSHPRQM